MNLTEKIKRMEEQLNMLINMLKEKHQEQLDKVEINFFAQHTKGQIDAYEEIISFLKS